ncbi:MAG TPA: hypothetical protein PLZ51_03215, partial [Aggregatilineales bacterium]|nr:hypothetical protein [Aggregatilineales bacterium]
MMKRLFLRLSFYLVFLLCLLTLSIPVTLGAGADNNVEWGTADVRHDTRDLTYRSPFGAVPTNTAITIRMRVR